MSIFYTNTASIDNLTATGSLTGSFTGTFSGNGSGLTGVVASAAPGGPDQSIQFNDAGATSGSSNFTFDKTTNAVTITGSLNISGSVTGLTGSLLGTASFATTAATASSAIIQGSNLISPYGQIVFSTGSNVVTNINATTYTSVFSQTITNVSVGDVIEVNLTGTIINNSGVARTYTISSSFGGLINISVANGATTAANATNRGLVELKLVYSISAADLAYGQHRQTIIGPVAANTVASAAVTGIRSAWQTTTSNATGTETINVGFVSSDATATQTFTLHSATIKRTPNRTAI